MATFPIPARLVKSTVLWAGRIFAELFCNPSSVIFRTLPLAYLWPSISAGAYQSISPSQYAGLFVSGVPPPMISARSDSLRCSQVFVYVGDQVEKRLLGNSVRFPLLLQIRAEVALQLPQMKHTGAVIFPGFNHLICLRENCLELSPENTFQETV